MNFLGVTVTHFMQLQAFLSVVQLTVLQHRFVYVNVSSEMWAAYMNTLMYAFILNVSKWFTCVQVVYSYQSSGVCGQGGSGGQPVISSLCRRKANAATAWIHFTFNQSPATVDSSSPASLDVTQTVCVCNNGRQSNSL